MAANNTTLDDNKTNNVYNEYKTTISELIANIEVYEHDLPKEVMVQISEIFRSVSSYENCKSDKKEAEWKALHKMYYTVINHLYVHAVFLFLKKINDYDKLFCRYNYEGVMVDDKNFAVLSKERKKEIYRLFVKELKKCYKGNVLNNLRNNSLKYNIMYLKGYCIINGMALFLKYNKKPTIPVNDYRDKNFKEIYQKAKELLELYQEIAPKVIQNGAKKTLKTQVILAIISWIIPVFLCANIIAFRCMGVSLISRIIEWVTHIIAI